MKIIIEKKVKKNHAGADPLSQCFLVRVGIWYSTTQINQRRDCWEYDTPDATSCLHTSRNHLPTHFSQLLFGQWPMRQENRFRCALVYISTYWCVGRVSISWSEVTLFLTFKWSVDQTFKAFCLSVQIQTLNSSFKAFFTILV